MAVMYYDYPRVAQSRAAQDYARAARDHADDVMIRSILTLSRLGLFAPGDVARVVKRSEHAERERGHRERHDVPLRAGEA